MNWQTSQAWNGKALDFDMEPARLDEPELDIAGGQRSRGLQPMRPKSRQFDDGSQIRKQGGRL